MSPNNFLEERVVLCVRGRAKYSTAVNREIYGLPMCVWRGGNHALDKPPEGGRSVRAWSGGNGGAQPPQGVRGALCVRGEAQSLVARAS